MLLDQLPFSPQLIQAGWVLQKLPSERFPKFAVTALEKGYDGNYVRRVAGLDHPVNSDLLPLMPGFLNDLGLQGTLSVDEAGWILTRLIARGICDEQIRPYDGARYIWKEVVNCLWPNQQHPLLKFVGTAVQYEECESYSKNPEAIRREIDAEIIADAREVLANAK
jgi:hypothetical protein